MDDRWAAATNISLISAIVVLSIVVLTGYAGQFSLGQWALAGCGALIAGSFVLRLDFPFELAIPLGVLLTIPVGLLFALPALRTRGVNLAIVTLGLGFTIQAVVFANGDWIGARFNGEFNSGTKVGNVKLFGIDVNNGTHPQRWAVVCLVAFVFAGVVVANLRRSRTGRRLIAVRTNERAAASLGISVFGVKLYAFSVAAAIAGLAGILLGFQRDDHHVRAVQPGAVDLQRRLGGDRWSRLRRRRGLLGAQRHRRPRHPVLRRRALDR